MSENKTRQFSSQVVDGMERAPSRAMLYPVGFTDADFQKPQIGVASTWSMVTPCNMHINTLADDAAAGVNAAEGKAVIFNTITISDGISMGTEGMKYSLVSREVIADSIETALNLADGGVREREIHPRRLVPRHRAELPLPREVRVRIGDDVGRGQVK